MYQDELVDELIRTLLESDLEQDAKDQAIQALKEVGLDTVRELIVGEVANALWGVLPGGLSGSSKNVVCSMPHNRARVAKAAALQCQNSTCSLYFCKKHSIAKCPICGSSVA